MPLRQVLAIIDFSNEGIRAAWRAARLACSQGAPLCLLTLVELPDGRPSSRFGATAPPVRARADLMHLAEGIRNSLGIHPAVVVATGPEARSSLDTCARRSSIAVVASFDHLAMRLPRDWGLPVLIARRPPGCAHRRAMAIARPGSQAISRLLAAARWFCEPEGIALYQPLDRGHARSAEAALAGELTRAGLDPAQGKVVVRATVASLIHEKQRSDASLLVAAMLRQPWWKELLKPCLARQLAAEVGCDVLLVPEDPPASTHTTSNLTGGYLPATATATTHATVTRNKN